MTLQDWLKKLETYTTLHLPPTLTYVKQIADTLHLLPVPYPVITVTGTNGKGSTTTACEQILKANGYRVGAFTSPHLLRFNERIRIDGKEAVDADLVQAFMAVEAARQNLPLNYFQFITLAALWLFKRAKLEAAVLEVGIGGRLDAVNIVDADVAVITNVGLDHQATLGDTRDKIGFEKAGILRANRPVVLGDAMPESVLVHAKKVGAVVVTPSICALPKIHIDPQNAANAITATQLLKLPLTQENICAGLKNTYIPARLERFQKHCEVIVDVAHNTESMQHLVAFLDQHPVAGKTHIVFSALADKDISGMIAVMNMPAHWYIAELTTPRAASLKTLEKAMGVRQYCVFDHVIAAYEAAMQAATKKDRVVVCGSFYTVAKIYPLLGQ